MKTNLSHECYKMVHQRSSWLALLVLFFLMLYAATPTAYLTKNIISQGFGAGQWTIIIMIALSANFIAMEWRNNTMTTLLYKSPNHQVVYFAKLIALIGYSIFLLIVGLLFTFIIKSLLVNNRFAWSATYHQYSLLDALFINLLGVGIYLLFTITLSLLLVSLVKSSAVVIVIGLMVGFLGSNISAIIMHAFPSLKGVLAWNPLNMINVISQLTNPSDMAVSALTNQQLIAGNLIYAGIFLVIGLLVFKRKGA